ncbi:DUF6220 domain-containing protein [Nonomuraea sediminis]|uniref:DUF6220 domain-containing protein n=1 Tax=Nonomuraea sediminis TaxID=2835864 RepID=UPI001BDD7BC1|nr:DUF6220 domain-containing protein [Nonomuraea sediminis]
MRRVLVWFTILQLVLVILQFYLATFGAFQMPRPTTPEGAAIGWHAMNGIIAIPAASLLTTIVAAIAKAPGKLIGLCAAPLVLVAIQIFVVFPLAEVAGATEERTTTASLFVFGFHAIVGLGLLGAAIAAYRGAKQHAAATAQAVDAV